MKVLLTISCLAVASTFMGCTILKTYKSDSPLNLNIISHSSSDIKTNLHLYSINRDCRYEYIGTVVLKSGKSKLALPINKVIKVEIEFYTSSFLGSDKSISYSYIIKPRKGYLYSLKSKYIEDMYDVSLNYIKSGTKKNQEVPVEEIDYCYK